MREKGVGSIARFCVHGALAAALSLLAAPTFAQDASNPQKPTPQTPGPTTPAPPTPTPAKPTPQKPAPQKPVPQKPLPAAPARQSEGIGVRGFATLGGIAFSARDSFETVLGSRSGVIYGGGGQVLLPWGIYVEMSAAQFKQDGERVFVGPDDEVFRLGIPVQVTIRPVEITGGFRYRKPQRRLPGRRLPPPSRFVAYGGLGFSSYGYTETSELNEPGEDVDERFSGFHLVGGGEYQVHRWVAVGAEVAWSSIADALGNGGVSAAFDEDNLGGTSIRLKISVGR